MQAKGLCARQFYIAWCLVECMLNDLLSVKNISFVPFLKKIRSVLILFVWKNDVAPCQAGLTN